MITTSITIVAARAIVRSSDRNLPFENGGPISITTNWAKSLLFRLNYVKRRGSSTAKMTGENLEAVKEQLLLDINALVRRSLPSWLSAGTKQESVLSQDHRGPWR